MCYNCPLNVYIHDWTAFLNWSKYKSTQASRFVSDAVKSLVCVLEKMKDNCAHAVVPVETLLSEFGSFDALTLEKFRVGAKLHSGAHI